MTTILPTDRPIRYCVIGAGDPITGETPVGNLTGVNGALSVIADADENAFVAALPASAFPPLPDAGWLEAGNIYQYEGAAVIVRQSHYRTIYTPADTPALFIVYREAANTVLDWVAGESVTIGTRRMYDGVTYECVQSHVTQEDWTPPAVPALWRVVAEEPEEPEEPTVAAWAAYTAYKAGDVVTYNGASYSCQQAHTSLPGWEPPNVLALWLPLSP